MKFVKQVGIFLKLNKAIAINLALKLDKKFDYRIPRNLEPTYPKP